MHRILVTGGAGFIGSHTCKALAGAGFEPVTYDSLESGHRDAVRWGPLVIGDIADRFRLTQAIVKYQPVAVVHFAAYAYVGESVVDPAKYYHNNVVGTLSMLETCRNAGLDRLIFSSSCATYGVPETLPIFETMTQRPINPYGRSKLMVEEILRDEDAAYGLRHVALRYFNAAGADPDGDLRERHDPETHLIPLALMAASGQGPALQVFGTDYPTPDGTCIRDYVHVSDLAAAHVNAVRYLLDDGTSMAANLGTGQGTSVREIIDAIEGVTGNVVPVVYGPRRPGDPPALYADPSVARARLDFVPRYSDIETIVHTAAPSFGSRAAA